MRAVALSCVALAAAANAATPLDVLPRPFLGLSAFGPRTFRANMTSRIKHEKSNTKFHYDVTHAPAVVPMHGGENDPRSVRCTHAAGADPHDEHPHTVELVFDTAAARRAFGATVRAAEAQSSILVGMCSGNEHAAAFALRATGVSGESKVLRVNGEAASFEDVFEHADVDVDIAPELLGAHANAAYYDDDAASSSDCTEADEAAGKCNVDIDDEAEHGKTWTLVQFDYNNKKIWSDNKASLKCTTCGYKLTAGVKFAIKIRWNTLKGSFLSFHGNANADLNLQADASVGLRKSGTKDVANIKGPSILFWIGVFPVYLDIQIPVQLGYDVDMSARGTASTGIGAQGKIEAGIQSQGNGIEPVFGSGFRHSFSKPVVDTAGWNMHVKGYLHVIPHLTMNKVMRFHADVHPYLSLEGDGGLNQHDLALYEGLDVVVGGQIGVKLGKFKLSPTWTLADRTVFERRNKVWSL